MLFDNPIFEGWYTDLMDVFRVVAVKDGSISRQERKKVGEGIPCRVYHTGTGSPSITDNAARRTNRNGIWPDRRRFITIRLAERLPVWSTKRSFF